MSERSLPRGRSDRRLFSGSPQYATPRVEPSLSGRSNSPTGYSGAGLRIRLGPLYAFFRHLGYCSSRRLLEETLRARIQTSCAWQTLR